MANTLYVGSDQEYTSIQAAIEAAQNGDTIVLKENVTSTGSISIVDKNITVDLGGFTLDAQVYIKNASDVEFKNGSMTYTNTNPSFGSAVITTGIYTDENGKTFSSGGAAALTLTGVNIYGGEAVDSYNYTHAVYYKSTGGLTITDCTVTGGTATRTENSTISRTENNTTHGIYASNCDGDIVIKNSTISGGYGNSEGETRINAGHPVGGGDAIYLSGKSNVTIEDSTVSGGSSKWYNANAGINVTNQFSGTLTVVNSTVTGGTAEGKNPSSSTSGIGGVGIYTNMSTSCKEITITDSAISGGDGGMSWNGSGIEYRNANIKLTITGSTVEAGNGENASATGSIGALMIANSTSTQIVLDDVKLNGEGNGNAVIKGGDKGVTFVGPVEVVGGTLENVKVSVDATGIEGTQAIISGNVGESVEVSVTGNENAAVIVEGGKTYITTETDPAAADTSVIYVNNAWADAAENQLVGVGKFLGVNAFADVNEAEAVAEAGAAKMVIAEGADVTYDKDKYYFLNTNPNEGGENNAFDNVVDAEKTYDMEINGTLRAYQILLNNAETTVSATGKAFATGEAFRVMGGTLTVQGSRAEDAGAPEEIFTGSWGGGVKAGADAQISAGYFMVNQDAVVSYNDTVIFVAAGIFSVDNADADFDNSYIYLGSVGTYQDVQLNFTNGANVTFANNTTVINDKAFGMDMVVDAGSTVTISDSEIMDLDTVRNTGSIVLTGDATLKAADLLSGSVITIEDLAAGDAREVTVTLIPEGQNTGKNITISVAKDATSATAYVTDFADGKYTCMLVDGGIGELRGEIELKNGSISMDATSTIVADTYAGNKAITVTVDVESFDGANKIIDLAAASDDLTINYVDKEGNALTADDLKAAGITEYKLPDGDVILANVDLSKLYVNSEYAGKEFGADLGDGKFFGINAFADFESTLAIASQNAAVGRIEIESDLEQTTVSKTYDITQNLTIGAAAPVSVTLNGANLNIYQMNNNSSVTIEENVTLAGAGIVANGFATSNNELVIDGTLKALTLKQWTSNNKITVSETGKVVLGYGDGQFDMAYGNGVVNVNGTLTDTTDLSAGPQFQAGYSGTRGNGNVLNLTNTYFEAGRDFTFNGSNGTINASNSIFKISGGDFAGALNMNSTGNTVNLKDGSRLIVANASVSADNAINVDGASLEIGTLTNNGTVAVTGESTIQIGALTGTYVKMTDATLVGDSKIGGNARTYDSFALAGTLSVSQTNFYGETVIKEGAVLNGSTTIVSGGSEFLLENGGTINSRFFNVVGGTANIEGKIDLLHSDPRQKLLQIHEGGVANINAGGNITIDGHNAWVKEGGTLNINGGTLNIERWDGRDVGGILYNEGGTVTIDWTGLLTAATIDNQGTITIDATDFTGGVKKVIDLNGTSSLEGKVTVNGLAEGTVVHYLSDGDVILANADMTKLYFDTAWADKTFGEELGDGKYFGINAFASLDGKVALVEKAEVLSFEGGNTESYYTFGWDGTHDSRFYLDHTATITTTGEGYALFGFDGQYGGAEIYIGDRAGSEEFTVTIDENAKIKSGDLCVWSKANLIIEGAITMGVANEDPSVANYKGVFNLTGSVTIAEGSDFELNGAMQNNGTLTVKEDFTISQSLGAGITVLAGRTGNGATAAISGATLTFNGFARGYSDNIIGISVKGYDSGTGAYTEEEGIAGTVTLTDGAVLDFNNAKFYIGAAGTLNASASTIDVEKEIINNGSITVDVSSSFKASSIVNNGTITIDATGFDGTFLKVIDVDSKITGTGSVKLANGTGYYIHTDAEGDIWLYKTPDTIYVSSDYNSSTEGWGYNKFGSWDGAYAFSSVNAKKATMVFEKTTTVSGNCFPKQADGIAAVVVKDGATVGNANSKWDAVFALTVEAGGILQSAHPVSAGYGNTHVKNKWIIGEAGAEKQAQIKFINGPGVPYKTMSVALLAGLNRSITANNALIEVGDLGLNASASFTDTTLTIAGILAIKGTSLYKTTMTDTTVTINGHNLMNENPYYSTVGTILATLTMDNTSITVDDGAADTAAEKVWLGYTGNVAQTLTMNNGSVITIEKGAEVEVANKVIMTDSKIVAGDINAGTTKYAGSNSFYFNGLEKDKVYWAVLYDAEGNELETIERTSTSGSTFYPKFSVQPAGDYKAVCYKDEAKTEIHQEKTYSFTAVGTLTLTNSDIVAETITLAGGNLTMDYKSTIAFTGIEGGYITVSDAASYVDNADVADGTYKLLDFTGTAAMTADDYKVILNDAWHDNYLVFNNDLYLTDQTASFIRVDAALKDVAIGTVLEDGSIVGFNAFATTKDAYMAARELGGEITIDLSKAGAETLDGTVGLGKAGKDGIYTITGGSVDTTSYGLSFADTETTVKFKDATFKLAKLYVANAEGSLIVENSVIGSAYYSGNSGGWVTAGNGSMSFDNSIFGANFSNYTAEELATMPRSASDVKAAVEAGTYKYWAFGANNSGPHMGTAGEIAVAGSTLSTSWISLIDRAEMVLDNSVLYYGAAISIGAGQVDNSYGSYNSNEIGWDAQIWWNPPLSSVDGFRDGEVATLTVKDSIVRNIGNGNGNSGAHVQVGGSYVNGSDNSVTGECAGVLNIINSEFYTTPYDADGNAVARDYDMIVVKSNGTVNVDDSTVVTAKLVNEGAFNVTGESTVKVGNVSGNGIVLDDATLTAESNIGGSAATRVYGNSTIKGTVGNVHANRTGTKENGLYAGYTTEEVALTLDGATTGLVYVGSDAEGYAAELTVKGGSEVGGIYNRVLGSTVITGSDNVIGYISAKGSITVENAENTYIEAMVAEGADINITNSDVEFAIGTSNNIQLDEGTTMTVTGSTLAIQQMSIDAASALVLNSSTITIDDVYDDVDLITNNGTITVDALSSITADTIENKGTIIIDAAKFEGGVVKVIDVDTTFDGEIKLINGAENVSIFRGNDGDVLLTNATSDALYVNAAWEGSAFGAPVDGYVFGFNAFAEINDAVALAATDSKVGTITVIEGSSSVIRANGSDLDITTGNPDGLVIDMGNHGISVNENGAYTLNGSTEFDHDAAVAGEIWNYGKVLTIGENVTVNADVLFNIMGATTNIDGIVNVNGAYAMSTDSINVGGTLAIKDSLTVVPGSEGGSLNIAEGAQFTAGNVNIKYDSYNTNIEGSVTVDKFTSLGDVTVGNNGAFTFKEATVGDLNVTTAFEVKEASLTAETMSLYSNLVIDGLKAGEAREVTLSVIPVGETEGFTVRMKVAAGATSAVYDGTEIPDGAYDFTVFDGMESISFKGVSVSGGSFSVADSTIDLGTLNGSANFTGENTIKVGTFNGNADIAGTNDVTIGTLNGSADITGTAELNIGSVTGIVALTDAAVSGTVGGKVGVYGTQNTISGESNISTLHVGYPDGYAVESNVAVAVTGNLTAGALVVGKYGTLNVGDAESDRTTLKVTGTINWINNSTVNLVNADVESKNALSMTGQVVLDNSNIKVTWEGQMNAGGSDGKVTLKNGSSLEYTSTFYVGGYYETQPAELEITSNSKFIGKTVLTSDKAEITVDASSFSATKINLKGALDLINGAEATINNLIITGTGALSIDLGSTISFAALSNAGTITIDATGAAADMIKVLDYTGTADLTLADYGTVSVINGDYTTIEIDNDLYIVSGAYSETDVMVNTAWTDAAFGDKVAEGRFFGINAYDSLNDVAADDTLTKVTFTGKEEISNLEFAASALEIVFQSAEFTGDLTLNGAELSIDADSKINGTITADTGFHVYGGGTIGNVNGAGRFDAEYITAANISGFSTVNTDELKAAAITLTNGSDTLNVKENLTVEGTIDFGTGKIDEMVLAENATVTAGVINTVGAMSVTIDLGGAYKGEAAITVAENGIFASGDLVLNLDLVNATLGDTNILVSGITEFKGTLVYSNVEYALGDILKFAGKDYTITLEDNALVLNAAGVSTSVKSDVDGNGYSDIVMLHEAGFSGAWLTQSNGSKVVWADLADKAENVELLGMGKANGAAALFFHNTENNYVGAWTLEGGKVTGYTDIDTFNPSAEVIGLGDFNGDGATDVLLRDNNEVGAHITGTGWTDYAGLGDNWEITAVGDFNADGKDDIVLVDKQGNHSGMWLMRTEANDEGNLFDWSALDTLSDGLEIVGAGDVNGDGCDDVLISKGEWLGAWIIEDGVLTGFQSISDKYAGTIEGVGDFNGDGIDDIQIRVGQDAIGYLVISAEGNAKWQQLGQDGLGDEWTTKFSAIC